MMKKDKTQSTLQSACSGSTGHNCRLDVITPLAKKINCLDVKRIADICVHEIPHLVGARLASLYILDENSDILHLENNNHPFLINNIVSLNQNPPSPMVAAVRSQELLIIDDVDNPKAPEYQKHTTVVFKKLQHQKLRHRP